MHESGENGQVGRQTRELENFDHEASTTAQFLEGTPTPEHHPLSAKQKLLALAAGVTLSALALVGYKHGVFNTAESEAKGEPTHGAVQNITQEPGK